MIVIWLARARQDLRDIASYIDRTNPTAATKVENRLLTAVEHLEQFPRAGRIGRKLGSREIVITEYPYIIRYRITAEHVQILRVFHTSTNWSPG